VRTKYLTEITDIEEKIKLATDNKMHNIAIDVSIICIDIERYHSWFNLRIALRM